MMIEYDKRIIREQRVKHIIIISIGIILVLIMLGFGAFEIYLWVHYGNMPKDQIPAWVWWWMIGGKR